MQYAISTPFLIRKIPKQPGVYSMKDSSECVIYIGKAKNLHARMRHYLDIARSMKKNIPMREHLKTQKMLSHAVFLQWSVTLTEHEALLLEHDAIKRLNPRYNILLRDDKTYPKIALTHHAFPKIDCIRGYAPAKAQLFGPYAHQARSMMEQVQKLLKLRTCSDRVFEQSKKPCVQYHIQRCSAPCVGYISEENYAQDVKTAALMLSGQSTEAVDVLKEKMKQYSNQLRFEEAAILRDTLANLEHGRMRKHAHTDVESIHFINETYGKYSAYFDVLHVRYDQLEHHEHRRIGWTLVETSNDIITQLLLHYYARHALPMVLVVPTTYDLCVLQERFSSIWRPMPQIRHPCPETDQHWIQTGRAMHATLKRPYEERLNALSEQMGFSIQRIECVDVSHHHGELTVFGIAAMTPMGFPTAQQKAWLVEPQIGGDDLEALCQGLQRRLKRPLPDIFCIDGGMNHLQCLYDTFYDKLHAHPWIIAIAKGEGRKAQNDHFFRIVDDKVQIFEPDSLFQHILQDIRNHAHRYAIRKHRSLFAKKYRTQMANHHPILTTQEHID